MSALSFMLVPDIEQNLLFLCMFGCYPILRSFFHKLPKALCLLSKFLYFNIVVIALEALVMLFFVPEAMEAPLLLLLLLLGNVTFFCYDLLLPRVQLLLDRRLGRFLPPRHK